jgi:hypothetical protein
MRVSLGIVVVASFIAVSSAQAQEVAMSCAVQDTTVNHARRTWELSFDQANQLVYIAKTVATAAITEAMINFRVDLGTGVPFTFVIDRASGAIRVSGSSGALYTGQCKVIEARGS